MTQLTAAQCAQTAGVSKRTIQNNIKQGKLSATKDDNGYYLIDASELMRVYPTTNNRAKKDKGARETPEQVNYEDKERLLRLESEKQSLEIENKGLKKQIEILTQQLSKSENREQKLLETVSCTTKMLEYDKLKRKKILGIF